MKAKIISMPVYTVNEVAAMFKISRDTVDRAIKKKELRPYKLGDWRITQEQLDEWLETRRASKRKTKTK